MVRNILLKPRMGHYPGDLHAEFHKLISELCFKCASDIDAQTLIDDHREAVAQEMISFTRTRRSYFTKVKAETDSRREAAYMLVAGMVRSNLKHFDQQVRDAALHVHNLLAIYGYVYRLAYDAKTLNIDSMVGRLRSERYQQAVELLGLTGCINHLDAINAEFKSYVEAVARESINRPKISFQQARKRSDFTMRMITDRVESLVNINGEGSLKAFANEYNALVNHYNRLLNEHLGRIHARRDISDAVIVSIAPRTFTGKPVTVIPEVSLLDHSPDGAPIRIDLSFPDDFLITYHNNIQRGMATVTIHGTGRYNGECITTFDIV